MYRRARSELGHPLEDEDEADEERGYKPKYVHLPYPEALAYDLWLAWDRKHVMARKGGYLDQPRRWQKLIHFMNNRYGKQWDQAKEDTADEDAPRKQSNEWDEDMRGAGKGFQAMLGD